MVFIAIMVDLAGKEVEVLTLKRGENNHRVTYESAKFMFNFFLAIIEMAYAASVMDNDYYYIPGPGENLLQYR